MKIEIRGLEIEAAHGVHEEEKINKQKFIFDIDLYKDFFKAAEGDCLEDTINYSAVCALVQKITAENTFNLIEKLAYECASAIMDNFPADSVDITVNKPQAPVKQKISTVAVNLTLKRTVSYLSLGSSEGDREDYLKGAIKSLEKVKGITVEKVSSVIATPPYGGVAKNEFLNCAVQISTYLPPLKLLSVLNGIEAEFKRERTLRWGDRTLDIDIIFYGSEIIKLPSLCVPHREYAKRDFVIKPLKEIAPGFYCPDTGVQIKDL